MALVLLDKQFLSVQVIQDLKPSCKLEIEQVMKPIKSKYISNFIFKFINKFIYILYYVYFVIVEQFAFFVQIKISSCKTNQCLVF